MILACRQTMNNSCGAVGLTVALIELQLIPLPNNIRGMAENVVYPIVQFDVGDYSTPARMARYARNNLARTSIMESIGRTSIIIVGRCGAVLPQWWKYYYKELWTQWKWRFPKGLSRTNIDNGERALVVAGIHPGDGTGLHYLLFRRDHGNYYVMDPACGDNQIVGGNHLDAFLSFRGGFERFGNGRRRYINMGIALWLST